MTEKLLDSSFDENLREINGGAWEGAKYASLMALYPYEFKKWIDTPCESYCPGGESVKELTERFMNALLKIAKENDNKTVAIFTHATPIRVAQTVIEKGALDEMNNVDWVSNASVTVINYKNDLWEIEAVSLDKHLNELKTVFAPEL